MCFKQEEAIFILSGKPLKLVNQFIYLGGYISSTENNFNVHFYWQVIDHTEIIK